METRVKFRALFSRNDSQILFSSITSRTHLLAWERMQHRNSHPRQRGSSAGQNSSPLTEQRRNCLFPLTADVSWDLELFNLFMLTQVRRRECHTKIFCSTVIISVAQETKNSTSRAALLGRADIGAQGSRGWRIFSALSRGQEPVFISQYLLIQYPSSMYHCFNWEEQTKGLNILWWSEC